MCTKFTQYFVSPLAALSGRLSYWVFFSGQIIENVYLSNLRILEELKISVSAEKSPRSTQSSCINMRGKMGCPEK